MTTNAAGLERKDYKGASSTLCRGCGHDSISNQIVNALFEMDMPPHRIVKLSGIGCSSKSPAYFLNRSHGFNSVHGRMPTVATGALLANRTLRALGVSGDGDTGSIGLGHFKHLIRRNVRMLYIVENNGVYGLTKGQFSATAEKDLRLKQAGLNPFAPIDLCLEALASGATFVARSFSGDTKQLKALVMAALRHRGTAVLDVISPCVTFNDRGKMSYDYGKAHREILHDIFFVPPEEEIRVDYEPGSTVDVRLHDGTVIRLQKLGRDYDPTRRVQAMGLVEESHAKGLFVTGLLYVTEEVPDLAERLGIVEEPLAALPDRRVRPSREAFRQVMRELALGR
jgi:2-oxoglutarate ferredoxin oxidoreductase subunit beta